MLKIEGYELERFDDGYYSNIDYIDIRQDQGPMLVIERVRKSESKQLPAKWRARITNGPWCENLAFQMFGSFKRCKEQLARALREEQHIYS